MLTTNNVGVQSIVIFNKTLMAMIHKDVNGNPENFLPRNQKDIVGLSSLIAWILICTLAALMAERGWVNLYPVLWSNIYLTFAIVFVTAFLAVAFTRILSNLPVQRFCVNFCALYLTMPLWLCVIFALLFEASSARVRYFYSLLVISVFAGLLSQIVQKNGFNGDSLLALLQTHPNEVLDFITESVGLRLLVIFLVQALCLLAFRNVSKSILMAMKLGPALIVFGISISSITDAVPPVKEMWQYVKKFPVLAPAPEIGLRSKNIDVILLLGESTSRWHMQVYGYPYANNPRLMQRGEGVIRLLDAISPHSHTVQSVSSVMLRENLGIPAANQSLVSSLRAAGVETKWLSTQTGFGVWDSPIRQIARDADFQKFFKKSNISLPRGWDFELGLGEGYTADSEMIRWLISDMERAQENPTFWVAHLTVGHADYCRYITHAARRVFEDTLRGERYFGNSKDETRSVNCYDSGIYLLDGLIDDVISHAERRSRPTLVVFSPDHGEDPDGGTGHSSGSHSARHIEVPVLFYFNDAAKELANENLANLKKNSDRPFLTSWLHESILDIFGLNTERSNQKQYSIFSENFSNHQRIAFDGTSPLYYDSHNPSDRKDYLSRARLKFKSQSELVSPKPKYVFSHRTNTELALIEAMQYFDGVEMDVVFDEKTGQFNVHHPPMSDVGFTLERALEIAQVVPGLKFWLDWKNASAVDSNRAMLEIDRLNREFNLKERVWIETDYQFPSGLHSRVSISSLGYRHSHYLLPEPGIVSACVADKNSVSCINAAKSAADQALKIGAQYVSFDFANESFGLAVLRAEPRLKALTWDLRSSIQSADLRNVMARSSYAEVLLIRMPSRFLR